MAIYNETELNNANNIIEQAAAINNLSGGVLSIMLLGVGYIVLFVAIRQVDTRASVFATALIMTPVVPA
jgi:hypothetical protein